MQSVSVGFPVRTSRHASVVRRIAAALVLVSGSLFLLTGCDSETLDTSTSDQQARALAALGSETSVLAYADVHSLLNESGPFIELLPDEARTAFRTSLTESAASMGLNPYEDVHGVYFAVADAASGGLAASDIAAVFFIDLADVPLPPELEDATKRTIAGHDVYESGPTGAGSMFLARYNDEAIVLSTSDAWMERALESMDLKNTTAAFPDILTEVSSSDAWIVVSDVDMLMHDAPADLGQYSAIVNQVARAAAGVVLQDGVFDIRMLAEPSEATTSEDLASVARAAKALLRMQNDVPDYVLTLSERITVEERRDRVLLSMRIDVELAQTLMEKFGG